MPANEVVTRARLIFETLLIKQFNLATMRVYQSGRFKFCCNKRNSSSMYSQHFAQKLVSKRNRIIFYLVARLQKPTTHAARNIMQCIAGSRLFDLSNLKFGIANDHVSNALALC